MKYKFKKHCIPIKLFQLFLMHAFVLFLHIHCSDGYLSLFRDKEIVDEEQEEEPYTWPKRIGGINDDSGFGLASDIENNIIITGYITGSVDFNNDSDISDASENDDADSSTDIFIIKYSSRGTFKWAKRLGGVSDDKGYAVAVDTLDNIIVTGSVTGDADLNGDGDYADDGETAAGIFGQNDIFIVKFDSVGNYIWSKRLGGASDDTGQGIVADSNNNIAVTGIIEGNADLNGNGNNTDGGAEDSSAYNDSDLFVSKFDSSGTWQWSKRLGGSDTFVGDLNSIAAKDSNNNLILSGTVTLNADLNGDGAISGFPETPGGSNWSVMFISKFDSSGTWQWAKRLGGADFDEGIGISADMSDNVIVTGKIDQSADTNGDGTIDPGLPETPTAVYGDCDISVSKFDSSGSPLWSKRLGGTLDEDGSYLGNNITADSTNNVIVTGEVQGDADLNGNGNSTDGGAEDSSGYGSYDIFVTKFDSAGTWQWAKRIGGMDADEASNIIVSNSKIFLTGDVTGNADLDGDGNIVLQSTDPSASYFPEDATDFGGKDIFISVFNNQ